MPSVEILIHRGQRVILADYRGLAHPQRLREAAELVSAAVRREPPGTALVLVDVSGLRYSLRAARMLTEHAMGNVEHVRARAVVGLSEAARPVLREVTGFSRRPVQAFETREAALDWLVEQRPD